MLTRNEFVEYFDQLDPRIQAAESSSPLWIPEQDTIQCQWFVCAKPINASTFDSTYFTWCQQMLQGAVLCFSSDTDNQQEWWGFTHQEDIPLWMLKWM
jgi:hypothetical protein